MNVGHDLRESLRRAAATAPSEAGAWDRFERRLRRRRAARTWTAGVGMAVAVVVALVIASPNLPSPSGSGAGGGGMASAAPDTFVALSSYPMARGVARYDARSGRQVQANPVGESGLDTYALGPDGGLLLAQASPPGRCEVTLDRLDWRGARTSIGSVAMLSVLAHMAVAPDGRRVALAGRTCAGRLAVAVASVDGERAVPQVLVEVSAPVSSLSFSSDGRLVGFVTGSRAGEYTARVLDTVLPPGAGARLPAFRPVTAGCEYRAIAFGADNGKLLAASTCRSKQRSELVALDLRSGRPTRLRTAPGLVSALDYDAGRAYVLMQLAAPNGRPLPGRLYRWDGGSAPRRIPVPAGVGDAQW